MAHVCLNCGHKYAGNFCNECGQKAKVKRLDWHYLVHEIPHSILHIDKGFFFTIKEMLIHPGLVIREYLDGKRVKYFPPLTYLIVLGTLAGLIYLNMPILTVEHPNTQSEYFLQKFTYLFGKNYNFVVLASVPLFALVVWLFYRKERNFIEITTAHFFIFGTINLAAIFTGISMVSAAPAIKVFLSLLSTVFTLGYQIWSYATVFVTRSKGARLGYAILLTFICSVISIAITVLLVVLYMNHLVKTNPEILNGLDVTIKPR